MSTTTRSRTSTFVDPAKHVNFRQQKLVDETVKNHLKYNDATFRAYLKLRQELLQQNNTIQLLLREYINTSHNNDEVNEEKLPKDVGETEDQDQVMKDAGTSPENNKNQRITELDGEMIKLEKLKFEIDKRQVIFSLYVQDLKNSLAIESRKCSDGYKSPELIDISKQLNTLVEQESQLRSEIDNIKNVQKPLLDKITNLVSNFNTNIVSTTARIIHPSVLRNKDENLENSIQVNYKHLVFSKNDVQQMFSELDDNINEKVEDILETNNRIFDKFEEQTSEGTENDSTNLLYKIARSTLHDITTSTDLDSYDQLIDKSLKDIASSFKENQEIKSKWEAHARKVEKIKLIVEENDDDGDHDMN